MGYINILVYAFYVYVFFLVLRATKRLLEKFVQNEQIDFEINFSISWKNGCFDKM